VTTRMIFTVLFILNQMMICLNQKNSCLGSRQH